MVSKEVVKCTCNIKTLERLECLQRANIHHRKFHKWYKICLQVYEEKVFLHLSMTMRYIPTKNGTRAVLQRQLSRFLSHQNLQWIGETYRMRIDNRHKLRHFNKIMLINKKKNKQIEKSKQNRERRNLVSKNYLRLYRIFQRQCSIIQHMKPSWFVTCIVDFSIPIQNLLLYY